MDDRSKSNFFLSFNFTNTTKKYICKHKYNIIIMKILYLSQNKKKNKKPYYFIKSIIVYSLHVIIISKYKFHKN